MATENIVGLSHPIPYFLVKKGAQSREAICVAWRIIGDDATPILVPKPVRGEVPFMTCGINMWRAPDGKIVTGADGMLEYAEVHG